MVEVLIVRMTVVDGCMLFMSDGRERGGSV